MLQIEGYNTPVSLSEMEYKFPNQEAVKTALNPELDVADEIWNFMQQFHIAEPAPVPVNKPCAILTGTGAGSAM